MVRGLAEQLTEEPWRPGASVLEGWIEQEGGPPIHVIASAHPDTDTLQLLFNASFVAHFPKEDARLLSRWIGNNISQRLHMKESRHA